MGRGRATIYATITSGDITARAGEATCSTMTEDPAQVRAEAPINPINDGGRWSSG